MKWINIIGLCLQFFAFWFAAPELLGKEAMQRFQAGLIKIIGQLPAIFFGAFGILAGGGMAYFGVRSGMEASAGSSMNPLITMGFILGFSILYLLYIILFRKRTQRFIENKFATPLIEKLIINNEARQSALIIGAVLFTVGFFLQLTALILA